LLEKKYFSFEAAKLMGISKNTLFRWEKIGLLPFVPERDPRGWRLFSQKEVEWLQDNVNILLAKNSKRKRHG